MATLTPEEYLQERSKMDRPIPGQSLTTDPDNPAPYEQPPRFTVIHEANEYLWNFITQEEVYPELMIAISNGTPVMTITKTILFNEFQKGSFNPDLMLMLAEPLAYMLIALAERLDLEIVIDSEEEEGDIFGVQMEQKRLEELRNSTKANNKVPEGIITKDMAAELETLPRIDSLLSAPEEEKEEAPQQPSLMAPPEGQ